MLFAIRMTGGHGQSAAEEEGKGKKDPWFHSEVLTQERYTAAG